jgi:hypothetical protein
MENRCPKCNAITQRAAIPYGTLIVPCMMWWLVGVWAVIVLRDGDWQSWCFFTGAAMLAVGRLIMARHMD